MSDLSTQQPKQPTALCELPTYETPICTPCENDSAHPYYDQQKRMWIGLNRGDKVVSITQSSLDLDLRVQLFLVKPWECFTYDRNGNNGSYVWYDCLMSLSFSRDEQGVAEVWPVRKRRHAVVRAQALAKLHDCIVVEGVATRDKCATFEWLVEQVHTDGTT